MRRLIFLLFAACCFSFVAEAQKKKLEILEYDWGKPLFETDRIGGSRFLKLTVLKIRIRWLRIF